AFDEFPDFLTALPADLAEELRASLPPDDLAALSADLTVESRPVPFLGRLTALLAELAVALGTERLFSRLASHPAGLTDGHIPSSLGHLSHHLSMPDQRGSRLLALKTAKEAGRPLLHRLFTQARSLTNLASAPNFTDVRHEDQDP